MDLIRVATKRNLELKGAIFDSNSKDTVLVLISGICSNLFQNDLLYQTGRLLLNNNISTIIGHTMDAFSCFSYSDKEAKKQKTTGVIFDEFDKVFDDVDSYVNYAKNLGYKKIVLAGHSLGSNKIIHYLANTKDDFVDYFIVSSPVDLVHWFNVMPDINKCIEKAREFKAKNRQNDILPYLFGGFSPISARAALDFYNADNLKNCPVISGVGEIRSLASIRIKGTFVIGELDSLTENDPRGFLEKINSYCRYKNDIITIENASHIFYNKHDQYAQVILEIIKEKL